MCWVTIIKENGLKEAQKDIECFKVVAVRKLKYLNIFPLGKNKIFSYFRNYRYKLNKLYELKKPIVIFSIKTAFQANEGFHSYSLSNTIKKRKPDGWYKDSIDILHNFRIIRTYADETCDDCGRKRQTKIVKCVIPKGSHYAINEYGEIISDKIILKELIQSEFH